MSCHLNYAKETNLLILEHSIEFCYSLYQRNSDMSYVGSNVYNLFEYKN